MCVAVAHRVHSVEGDDPGENCQSMASWIDAIELDVLLTTDTTACWPLLEAVMVCGSEVLFSRVVLLRELYHTRVNDSIATFSPIAQKGTYLAPHTASGSFT